MPGAIGPRGSGAVSLKCEAGWKESDRGERDRGVKDRKEETVKKEE